MSDSNHSLNQSSKDVFAKPLLAAASLLDGSLALGLTQTPSQLSNSPNASIDPLTQPAQIAALAEAKSTDTLAVDNPTVFDLPQTLPPTIEQNGKDLITGNPLPRQVGIAASLPERGAAIQLIHLDDVSPEVHLASEVAVESAASVGATPVELPQAATSTQPFQSPRANLPLVGIIDTGLDRNIPSVNYESLTLGYDWVDGDFDPLLDGISSHGTRVLNVVQTTQTQPLPFNGQLAPTWIGRGVGAGNWANSLTEFVDYARSSGETGAVANLSFDLTETDANGNPTTRNFLTVTELAALQYAQQAGVLVVVAAGNQGEVLSALGATSTQFDNLITVGALDGAGRAAYSSYGNGLTLLAPGGTPDAPLAVVSGGSTTPAYGTSYAAAQVTGAISLIWQVNPGLNYQQVVDVLQQTATDLRISGWDEQTGYGFYNRPLA